MVAKKRPAGALTPTGQQARTQLSSEGTEPMKDVTSVPANTSKNPTIYALALDCLRSGQNFWEVLGRGRQGSK